MAVASERPHRWPHSPACTAAEDLLEVAPLLRLVAAAWAIPSVQRIALSAEREPAQMDLWIFMRDEVGEDEAQIYLLQREFRNADPSCPVEIHVYPLSRIDQEMLPPLKTVLER